MMNEEETTDLGPAMASNEPEAGEAGLPGSDAESKMETDEVSSEKFFGQKTETDREEAPPTQQAPPTEDGGRQSPQKTSEAPGNSRPHSSASTPRVKNGASGEIVFEAKKKKSKLLDSSTPDVHTVSFTVSIAMAIPTEEAGCVLLSAEDEEAPDLKNTAKKKQVFEAPRPQNYYHVEYCLVPQEGELIKTDVVTYGVAAKLYMERHDARVIKTWQDGELTWIAWAHSQTMTITKELLIKMFDHTLELRVWDTKDKCSSRARFDRPKAFRLPQPKPGENPEDVGGIRAMVMKQLNGFLRMQPAKAGDVRQLPQKCMYPRNDLLRKRSSHTTSSKSQSPDQIPAGAKKLVAFPNDKKIGSSKSKSFNKLTKLAGDEEPKALGVLESFKEAPQQDSVTRLRLTKKAEAAAAVAAEKVRKFGVCMVPLRMSLLFCSVKSLTSRLNQPVAGVEDLFITVSLSQPLLSEAHKLELNPMVITIKSTTEMPRTPLSHEDLRTRCQPVYCQYQFFKQPFHITGGKEHQENIYFDDKNVVLLGQQNPSELKEYLKGPSMVIEVHDRDRKAENVKLKATLFGDDLEDEKIGSVGTVTSRRTLHNAFHGRDKPWDPFGVCHVDLSELLLGHRFLELKLPIHNCPPPDTLGLDHNGNNRLVGISGAVDGPVDPPLPGGDYMRSGASLKLQIELTNPLVTPAVFAAKNEVESSSAQCAFGRIIFIFAYKNTNFLHHLQQLIMAINARGLDLDDLPQHVIDTALSTYKLSIEQQTSTELDIVTGFHVLDGEKHIFVLEGLRDKGVKQLWEELPRPENSDVRVLYNSDHSFSHRLYGPLDVDLCRVKLHEPLSLIVRQSLLYIRDMVPRPCFQGLVRLEEISRMHLMKDIVKNNIFPTATMVISMSKEFGVPFTAEDFEELRPEWERVTLALKDDSEVEVQAVCVQTPRAWVHIDNFNKAFLDSLEQRKDGPQRNFQKENTELVRRVSEVNNLLRQQTMLPTVIADVTVAHNYSTQALNSTELANEALRQVLKEDPDTRFTRCQEFQHSMTVPPVNVEALAKQQELESKARWRSRSGWIYPGKRSAIESNAHLLKPHPSRIEELQEHWRENLFHVSLLQPPLDRDHYPFEQRHHDFKLYGQAPRTFQDEPLSIHLPGIWKDAEKAEALRAEQQLWQSHLVVKDVRQHFHRLLPATEMTDSGFYSSNQIDRLMCLLKDPAQKYSFKKTHVRDIPPLDVVHNPSVDFMAREKGLPLPPALPDEDKDKMRGYKPGDCEFRSWAAKDNHIPVYNYEHLKYAARHGHDFNALHKERQTLWKRPIVPLTGEEQDNHLFCQPLACIRLQPIALPDIDKSWKASQDRTANATSSDGLPTQVTTMRDQEDVIFG